MLEICWVFFYIHQVIITCVPKELLQMVKYCDHAVSITYVN